VHLQIFSLTNIILYYYFLDWHLIIGGYRNVEYLAEVELFNWKSKKQCSLKDLPDAVGGHSGVNFTNITQAVFCMKVFSTAFFSLQFGFVIL
jgi:hypothetical protein